MRMIAGVAVVAIGATGAFFSDTETSTGNTFTAGAIDLTIDNQSYVTSTTTGQLVASPSTSWQLANLTNQLFFDFDDLKPGDRGEDTISLHVNNNDAYACMDVTLTGTLENLQTEPEAGVDNTSGPNEGELQNELHFAWWADDGDNVYEHGETIFKQGTAAELFAIDNQKWALADSQFNVWGQQTAPISGNDIRYIAKYWCFGDLIPAPLPNDSNNGPLVRGTGFSCSGAQLGNETQTDGIAVDVTFEAVQSRNNDSFRCNEEVCIPVNESLFADGFESGSFSAWTSADNDWDITSSGEHSGVYASVTNSSENDVLRKVVSTSGYNSIVLSYWYRITESFGSDDHVYVEWYDGSTWNEVAHYTSVSAGSWTQETLPLPGGADNNPSFEIRFRSVSLDGTSDELKLDDVSVSGNTICP